MQTIVYQYDTAMPAQKLPNCCLTLLIVFCMFKISQDDFYAVLMM